MDLKAIINGAHPDFVIFALTTLIAFLTWLLKGLIEKPVTESKETFHKYIDKRIEILTEIKTRLNFIAFFPQEAESKEYKQQIQDILLKDGRAGYLDKEVYTNVLKISIDPKTNEKLLLATIKSIDADLYLHISKIQDEVSFYRKFSNFNPVRRFLGLVLLSLQYLLSFVFIAGLISLFIYCLTRTNVYGTIVVIIIAGVVVFILDKWFRRQ